MTIKLSTEDEARATIKARIDSRQWWVFIVPPAFVHYLELIEDRFYAGERNRFFDVALLPGGLAVAMADKRFMSAPALAAVTAESGGLTLPAEAFEERDIIFPCNPTPEAMELALGFHEWIMGRARIDIRPEQPRAGKKRWRRKR